MSQRRVLFTFNHAPVGSIWYNEGLRAAVGVISGVDEHTVDIAYVGDGVYFALKDADRTTSAKYLGTLAAVGARLRAERESLEARGLSEGDLADDIAVISRSELSELVAAADLTIDF